MSKVDRTPPPEIDYLAKDYASFRRLMLDRLSHLVPDWREQSPADLGHAVVEVLAYAADYLSYYQDAVATEAYLGTARLRRSVRRHARLLDYHLHEGCNARAWVQIQVKEKVHLLKHTQLLTRLAGSETSVIRSDESAYHQTLQEGVAIFETMYDADLLPARNEISFYYREGGDEYLPKGSTRACLESAKKDDQGKPVTSLKVGDVLVFEELRDPHTGLAVGANPAHRHVVRLTKVTPRACVRRWSEKKLLGLLRIPEEIDEYLEIEWAAADALPFALYIAPHFDGQQKVAISVARGNIVLADHGRTIRDEELPVVEPLQRYRPRLRLPGLIHAVPFYYHIAEAQPASEAVQYDPQEALPWVVLRQCRARQVSRDREDMAWTVRRDLLNSGPYDRDYLVETEEDGTAYLRFGFGGMGKLPLPGDRFVATYRIGNGTRGNIGADAIAHVVLPVDVDNDSGRSTGQTDFVARLLAVMFHKLEVALTRRYKFITAVRNPLPARGGRNPEDIESARLNAPHAFRTQQTCVTEADHAKIAARHPAVARAVAQTRWIGSRHTVFVYAKRANGQPEDDTFRYELRAFMEPYRLLGHDIAVEAPRYVPVRVKLRVHLKRRTLALAVQQRLSRAFSEERWPDGEEGFFYPDRFGFGQSVHQSQVIARAMAVAGVARIEVEQFRRGNSDLDVTEIPVGTMEIARLDRIEFEFEGGHE